MRNHHEKARDMARTLPSSKLGVKDWRRNIHHSERGRVRAALHRARITHEDDLNGLSDDAVDADHTRHRVHEMVQERRIFVSVGPLLRWAEHHLDRDPNVGPSPADALDFLTSRLPYGVVGRPAATRIAKTVGRADTNRWIVNDSTVAVRDAVRWVMASGLHAELNRHLRKSLGASHPASSWKPDEIRPTRFLRGWHDIDGFTAYGSNVKTYKRGNGLPSHRFIDVSTEGQLATSFAEEGRPKYRRVDTAGLERNPRVDTHAIRHKSQDRSAPRAGPRKPPLTAVI